MFQPDDEHREVFAQAWATFDTITVWPRESMKITNTLRVVCYFHISLFLTSEPGGLDIVTVTDHNRHFLANQ